jgi:hypothetical protein
MSCSFTSALKAARVSYNTVRAHERNDPEFAALLREAEEEGAEMLHHVCWKAALEGNIEPVYFQGQIVGHIRKYDSRMQIEMLRAHMPQKFKTPGSKGALVGGNVENLIICGPEEIAAIQAARQEALEAMKPKAIEVVSERTIP